MSEEKAAAELAANVLRRAAPNVNNRVWRIRFQRSADELAPLAGGGARG